MVLKEQAEHPLQQIFLADDHLADLGEHLLHEEAFRFHFLADEANIRCHLKAPF